MAHGASSLRILLIAPLGTQPWCPSEELAEAFRALGHDVVVATDDGADRFPWPRGFTPTEDPKSQTTPARVVDRVRAFAASTREMRALLRRTAPDVVIVWEPTVALALRTVRKKTTRIVWVRRDDPPQMRREHFIRAAAALTADTFVVPTIGSSSLNTARQIVVPPFDGAARASDEASEVRAPADWVALTGREPSDNALAALVARSGARPAAAIVVDGRSDVALTAPAERLATFCRAERVVQAVSDSWLSDGTISEVIDPSEVISELDHRHRAALDSGVRLRIAAGAAVGPAVLHAGVTLGLIEGGWRTLTATKPLRVPDVSAWAAQALTNPAHPRAAVIAEVGEHVLACPACGSRTRNVLREIGPSSIFRCDACSLVYGSPKVPDDVVYDEGYHDGTGGFGTNYVQALWYCEQLADDRLRSFERAGVKPTRMIDLGTGLGHFVQRARLAGWDCDGLELVPTAVQQAKALYGLDLINERILDFVADPRYKVAALGQTLEHFTNPVDVLDHIRTKVLAPGGLLMIEVPNVNSLHRLLRRGYWLHWQPGDHVLFFSARTLVAVLDRAGFEVVASESTSGVFPGLGTPGVLYSLGIYDASRGWGSVAGIVARTLRRRLLRGRAAPVSALGEPPATPMRSVGERGVLALAGVADRVGRGDSLRVIARAR